MQWITCFDCGFIFAEYYPEWDHIECTNCKRKRFKFGVKIRVKDYSKIPSIGKESNNETSIREK